MSTPILTSIGEQGVSVGNRHVRFRPSFLAMTRIGTPREIVQCFVDVCGVPAWLCEATVRPWQRGRFAAACVVLLSCTDEDDLSWLIGYVNERGRYVPGALPLEDIVGLASGLLRHGVTGDAKPDRNTKKADYSNEFDARAFVSSAMAHLGTSESEAWNMTMTSYIHAMRAKFPPPADAKPQMTAEDVDHVQAWLERVNRAGAKAHG